MFNLMLRWFGLRKKGDIEFPYDTYMKITTMTLRICGLWKSGEKRELDFTKIVPYSLIMITGMFAIAASIYDTRDDFSTSVDTLLYQILLIHSFNAYMIMIYNIDKINCMMSAIESRFDNYEQRSLDEETNMKKTSENDTIFLTKFVTTVVCSVHVSHTIASKFYLPNSLTKDLFFPIVLPYNLHDHYYVAFILEVAIYILEGIMNLSCITINVGFVNILSNEFDIFGISLQNICGKVKVSDNDNRDKVLNKLSLKEIVNHHKFLIELGHKVESVLSLIVLDMFVTCEFMLCLSSFQIYQTYSTTTFEKLIKNVCMLTALIVHEFVYFLFGQRLVTKTSNIHRSIYFCDWYNETKEFKSSLNIIQYRTNKPFVMRAGKIVPVTLTSFVKCLQAAFSYFNLLRALSHS